jgi:hypothetical protein
MADEITITIDKNDLGPPESEFGITDDDLKLFDSKEDASLEDASLVKVFVDGELVDPTTVTEQSITVKLPASADGMPSTVVVTTKRDKILNVLQYDGNKKIVVKDPPDDETTLKDIAKAIKKIAELMAPPTPPGASTPITSDKPSRTR